jgi:hypothetical protein
MKISLDLDLGLEFNRISVGKKNGGFLLRTPPERFGGFSRRDCLNWLMTINGG